MKLYNIVSILWLSCLSISLVASEGNQKLYFEQLREAVEQNNEQKVTELLSQKENAEKSINCAGESSAILFIKAMRNNNLKIFTLLLESGADVNSYDEHGRTPLMCAVLETRFKMAELLLKKGAHKSINQNDKENTNSLNIAVFRTLSFPLFKSSNIKWVELLLQYGADVNKKGNLGMTLLMWVVKARDVELARFLLERGAQESINCFDDWGNSALSEAIDEDNIELINLLIEHGADVNKQNGSGVTPRIFAVNKRKVKAAEFFLKKGAQKSIDQGDRDGWTPLLIATKNNNIELVNLLLLYGADAYKSNKWGETPIELAAKYKNDIELADLLKMYDSLRPIKELVAEPKRKKLNENSIKYDSRPTTTSTQNVSFFNDKMDGAEKEEVQEVDLVQLSLRLLTIMQAYSWYQQGDSEVLSKMLFLTEYPHTSFKSRQMFKQKKIVILLEDLEKKDPSYKKLKIIEQCAWNNILNQELNERKALELKNK